MDHTAADEWIQLLFVDNGPIIKLHLVGYYIMALHAWLWRGT
jgi:hypothetical protein